MSLARRWERFWDAIFEPADVRAYRAGAPPSKGSTPRAVIDAAYVRGAQAERDRCAALARAHGYPDLAEAIERGDRAL